MSKPPEPRPLPPAAIAEIEAGRLINAIKIVRDEWHLDLKSAKDAVDAFDAHRKRALAPRPEGVSWLAVILTIGMVVVALLLYWLTRSS